MLSHALPPGFTIDGAVAAGAMGQVVRARDSSGRVVGVKIVHVVGDASRARFSREQHALSSLHHPHIVELFDRGITPAGLPYLVMEWVEGRDLRDRIRSGGLGISDALALARSIADALALVHRSGLVHRDVKPSNIRLRDDDPRRAMLLDFGIAWLAQDQALTQEGISVGTPGYMPPEQIRGERVTPRVDVYALGCVLFACVCGRPPHVAPDLVALLARALLEDAPLASTLRPDVPPALDALLARLLSRDPGKRPVDGSELRAAIDALGPLDGPAFSPREQVVIEQPTLSMPRLLSVVLTMSTPALIDDATLTARPESAVRDLYTPLVTLGAEHGAVATRLSDGRMLLSIATGPAATDQARAAARLALAVRSLLGPTAIAVATGRGRASADMPLGEVIDCAVGMLDRARLTAQRDIRIDDATAGLLDGRFEVATAGDDYSLLGEHLEGDERRTLLGAPTDFVGREPELFALRAYLEGSFRERQVAAALIVGAAGIGKSRLRQELVSAIAHGESAVTTWIVRADPTRARSPLSTLDALLRAALDIRPSDTPAMRRRKLAARLQRHFASDRAQELTTFLDELFGGSLDRARHEPTLAYVRSHGDRLRDAFRSLLLAHAQDASVLLVLEDMHLADAASIEVIVATLGSARECPIALLAVGRQELVATSARHERDTGVDRLDARADDDSRWQLPLPTMQIRLRALSKAASRALVVSALRDATPALIDRVVERADGHPLMLEELVRAARRGLSSFSVVLPGSVVSMIHARIASLSPDAARVLQLASVFGHVAWEGGLRALLPERADRLASLLDTLRDEELLDPAPRPRFSDEREVAFRQTIVRDVAYGLLDSEESVLAHRRAEAWLVAMGENDGAMLADHAERGRELSRAGKLHTLAADQALEAHDFTAAVTHAARALELVSEDVLRLRLHLLMAEAARWRGAFFEVVSSCDEAIRVAEKIFDVDSLTRALSERASAYVRLGTLSKAEVDAATLIHRLDGAKHASTAVAGFRAATAFFAGGRIETARALLDRVEALVTRLPTLEPSTEAARCTTQAFAALYARDDLDDYQRQCERAAEAFTRAGDVRNACTQLINAGFGLCRLGRPLDAIRLLVDARARAERLGLDNLAAAADHNLGHARAALGELEPAIALQRAAIVRFTTQRDARLAAGARCYLAEALAAAGDLSEARQEIGEARTALVDYPAMHAFALAVAAQIDLDLGDAPSALARAEHALSLLKSGVGASDAGARVRLAHARSLHALGRVSEAREAARTAATELAERAHRLGPAGESYLRHVPIHAETMALSAELDSPSGLPRPHRLAR